MKDYNENEESLCIKYSDINKLYGWAMLQKPPVNDFDWIKDTSQFNEDFIKNYNKECHKDIFLKSMFNILKNYKWFIIFT